jgi:hypothetical protein
MWYEVHTTFHIDWYRISSNIKVQLIYLVGARGSVVVKADNLAAIY